MKTTLPRNPQTTETEQYFRQYDPEGCLGVSLTMKQSVDGFPLDEIRANENLRHFLNYLNFAVFGKRFRRFGMKLSVLPRLEKSPSGRWHYHLLLKKPHQETPEVVSQRPVLAAIEDAFSFEELIKICWLRTRYGYSEKGVHVHHAVNNGWNKYILKNFNAGDGVDWLNRKWD